jgi:hypothetical protein
MGGLRATVDLSLTKNPRRVRGFFSPSHLEHALSSRSITLASTRFPLSICKIQAVFKPFFRPRTFRRIPRPAWDCAAPRRPGSIARFARSSVIVLSCSSFQQSLTIIRVQFNVWRLARRTSA